MNEHDPFAEHLKSNNSYYSKVCAIISRISDGI